MASDGVEALQSLLESLADPTCTRCRWAYRCNLGTAGYVQISIDVEPYTLSEHDRDTILSLAARLTNWSHA